MPWRPRRSIASIAEKRSRGASRCGSRLSDSDQAVCCPGCRAAAQLISQLGLEDFYRFRTAPAVKPGAPSDTWLAYDEPALLDSLSRRDPRGRAVILTIDGLTCAACSWLIQRSLTGLDGVVHASVNTATGRAQVVWDEGRIKLSQLMQIISELGYRPHVVTADNADALAQAERRSLLKRLAVAGLGMMQVMMFAVALYVGEFAGDGRRMCALTCASSACWSRRPSCSTRAGPTSRTARALSRGAASPWTCR